MARPTNSHSGNFLTWRSGFRRDPKFCRRRVEEARRGSLQLTHSPPLVNDQYLRIAAEDWSRPNVIITGSGDATVARRTGDLGP
jgi:hypothetical protein